MTMEWGIFLFGVFITFLLGGGLMFTILEFRKMAKEPERYRPGKNSWSEPNKKPKRAA